MDSHHLSSDLLQALPTVHKRVDGLYFPDGNVIIEAEGQLFRVYQGFLSARSEVLSDLFSIPQPSEQELLDNCAVVHFPDSASDMTHFLRAVFHSGYFEPYPADMKAPAVFAILRMSHKYDVPYLRYRALQHLAILYPTTLEGLISYTHQMWVNMFIGFAQDHDYISVHFAAAQIAHEVDAVWLMPAILYWCSLFSDIDELLDGTLVVKEKAKVKRRRRERRRGSATTETHTAHEDDETEVRSEKGQEEEENPLIVLPLHYGRSCIKFKALDLKSPLIMNDFLTAREFDMKGSVCSVPRGCRPYRHKLFASVIEVSQDGPNIFAFQDAKYWRKFEHKLCTACYQFFKNHYSEARIQFWRELPEKFKLPSWPELRKMKEADLGYGSKT